LVWTKKWGAAQTQAHNTISSQDSSRDAECLPLADVTHCVMGFSVVQLGINLGDCRGTMTKDDAGRIEAEVATEPSGCVVTKLVGMPVRHAGVKARLTDGTTQSGGCVPLTSNS
jgi:hypothetical protein